MPDTKRRRNSIRQELWAIPKELGGRNDPPIFDDGCPHLPDADEKSEIQFADFELDPSKALDEVIIH